MRAQSSCAFSHEAVDPNHGGDDPCDRNHEGDVREWRGAVEEVQRTEGTEYVREAKYRLPEGFASGERGRAGLALEQPGDGDDSQQDAADSGVQPK